jgi:hypothetical protein
MKKSFIILNGATKNQDLIRKSLLKRGNNEQKSSFSVASNMVRTPSGRLEESKSSNPLIKQDKRPSARDGHTGNMIHSFEDSYLVVFGGDRHGMPFNDMHLLDLKQELAKANLQ